MPNVSIWARLICFVSGHTWFRVIRLDGVIPARRCARCLRLEGCHIDGWQEWPDA